MHVLVIHQVFAGPDDPGGTRHYEIGRYLVEHGHRVTVIASAVKYLTGEMVGPASENAPAGMRIVRLAGRQDLHRSFRARARAYVDFAVRAYWAAMKVPDVDVVWGTSPPLVQLLPAWLASRRCPGGFLLEERDLWPEFAVEMGVVRDGLLSKAALRMKRFLYGRARRIVINSPGFLPFIRGYGVPPEKIEVVPNGVDVTQFDPATRGTAIREAWNASDRFIVLYAGALGPANGLEVVLDAAERLRDTTTLFVLVGDGKFRGELLKAAEARGLANVRFAQAQPKRMMPNIVAAADACLATLRDIPLFRTTYPNKVFDYMAAGRPVLLGIDGVIRRVVEEAGAGVFVQPGDGVALAAAVRRLMDNPGEARAMGQRGRVAVCAKFNRRTQGAQIGAILDDLLSHRPPRVRVFSDAAAPADIQRASN
jgi:glycosyltransferase involved in cell wall biosynthesis